MESQVWKFTIELTGLPVGGYYVRNSANNKILRFGVPYGSMPKRFKTFQAADAALSKFYKLKPVRQKRRAQTPLELRHTLIQLRSPQPGNNMTIKYAFTQAGVFVAADLESCITCSSLPQSSDARAARTNPTMTATKMIAGERIARTRKYVQRSASYDASNLALIAATQT